MKQCQIKSFHSDQYCSSESAPGVWTQSWLNPPPVSVHSPPSVLTPSPHSQDVLAEAIGDVKFSNWYFLTLYHTVTLNLTKKCSHQWHYFHLTPIDPVAYFTIIQLPPLLLEKKREKKNYLVQLKVIDSRRTGNHQARSKSLSAWMYFREGPGHTVQL